MRTCGICGKPVKTDVKPCPKCTSYVLRYIEKNRIKDPFSVVDVINWLPKNCEDRFERLRRKGKRIEEAKARRARYLESGKILRHGPKLIHLGKYEGRHFYHVEGSGLTPAAFRQWTLLIDEIRELQTWKEKTDSSVRDLKRKMAEVEELDEDDDEDLDGWERVDEDPVIDAILHGPEPSQESGLTLSLPTNVRFEDIIVDQAEKEKIMIHLNGHRNRGMFKGKAGGLLKREGLVLLFAGPSGTGKTLMARAIANELKVPCWAVDLSSIQSKWVGDTEHNIGKVIEAANKEGVVLLFDEADSLLSARNGESQAYYNREISCLLQVFESNLKTVVILTSNLSCLMDKAFGRRIDDVIYFGPPNAANRQKILSLHLGQLPKGLKLGPDVNLELIARSHELTGGEIKLAVNLAWKLALWRYSGNKIEHVWLNRDPEKYIEVRREDIEKAMDMVVKKRENLNKNFLTGPSFGAQGQARGRDTMFM